jgi:CRP-like cAMP-binding protein
MRRVAEHSTVVRQGDSGGAFFVVIDGGVLVQGDRASPVRLGPGAFFGELALLDDGPRTASVRAEQATLLLEIPRSKFLTLVRDEPTIAVGMLRELARRLRAASARTE